MSARAAFSWFWQPPLLGDPGLLMIIEDHPGPDAIDVPLVIEDLPAVILDIETHLPPDIHLHGLRIYVRHMPLLEAWVQIVFEGAARKFTIREPDFSPAELAQLWGAREESKP